MEEVLIPAWKAEPGDRREPGFSGLDAVIRKGRIFSGRPLAVESVEENRRGVLRALYVVVRIGRDSRLSGKCMESLSDGMIEVVLGFHP